MPFSVRGVAEMEVPMPDVLTANKSKRDANLVASRMFADIFQAYLECSDRVQAAIRDMVQVANAPDATGAEREAALLTIAEALFPSRHNGELGVDLEESERIATHAELRSTLEQMNREEASFADRLSVLMDARGMTQGDLAEAIGVGQPAISMMLARTCRPQRRTVEKLAQALKVSPEQLWPGFHQD